MTPSSLNIADLKAKAVAVQTWWDKPINPQSGANEDVAESVQVIEAFMAAANHVAIGELIALLEQMTEALFDATADHCRVRQRGRQRDRELRTIPAESVSRVFAVRGNPDTTRFQRPAYETVSGLGTV